MEKKGLTALSGEGKKWLTAHIFFQTAPNTSTHSKKKLYADPNYWSGHIQNFGVWVSFLDELEFFITFSLFAKNLKIGEKSSVTTHNPPYRPGNCSISKMQVMTVVPYIFVKDIQNNFRKINS